MFTLTRFSVGQQASPSQRLVGLILLLAYSHLVQGQTQRPNFFLRRYVADVYLTGQRAAATGVLFDLTDSTVTLAPVRELKPQLNALISQHGGTLPPTDSLVSVLPLRIYRYSEMSRLAIHRRGHAGKGFLIGAILGAAIGLISGSSVEADVLYISAGAKAITGIILLGIPGLIIGAATKPGIAKGHSIAVEAPARFRKFTIVEQVRQATLYKP